jgi:hypothetical protein
MLKGQNDDYGYGEKNLIWLVGALEIFSIQVWGTRSLLCRKWGLLSNLIDHPNHSGDFTSSPESL